MEDQEPERYYDWILWALRQEEKKEKQMAGVHVDNDTLNEMRDKAMSESLSDSKRLIWVSFQREGIHKYPAALDDPKLATGGWDDVSFLGYPHRHMFHFRVWIEVYHDDREIEFIQFKRWLQRLYDMAPDGSEGHNNSTVLELDYKSCEMIADELCLEIRKRYGTKRHVAIEVSEDNENGCHVDYPGK